MAQQATRRVALAQLGAAVGAAGAWAGGLSLTGCDGSEETMQMQATTTSTGVRALEQVMKPGTEHWVGDGFYVSSVFHPQMDRERLSPFLLLDHAAPRHFEPTSRRRGVGEHPPRGFETVTLALAGEIDHRDSAGGGGRIGSGDVQWMTAGAGVVHEEMHSRRLAEQGGQLEMVQLWVNLPARDKMTAPRYQALQDRDFPRVTIGAAEARLIAGQLADEQGPAKTHTPMVVADLRFTKPGVTELDLPSGWTVLAFAIAGTIEAGADGQRIAARHLGVFDRKGAGPVRLKADPDARVLVLAGEPLNEPVAAYGPFVMTTREEITQAFHDYQSGAMGRLR